jgi:hypothetical protein
MLVVGLLSLTTPHLINSAHFRRIVNFQSVRDILKPGGTIIVVGDPHFSIQSDEKTEEPFLKWTGVKFYWNNARGDTVITSSHYLHHPYKEYLKHLKRWDYSLRSCEVDLDVLGEAYDLERMGKANIRPTVVLDGFSRNRYGNALAFSVRIALESPTRYEPVEQLGSVIILPKVELTEDEALVLILRDVCGVESRLPEPDWVGRYVAPGQEAIDTQIQLIRAEIEAGAQSLRAAEAKRESARKYLRLLYDRGDSLEEIVREVLRGLGAEVEDPENPGQEDGWITVRIGGQVLEGVLEVKSTRNPQFGLEGIRQLLDWVNRGVEAKGKKHKGIFVGSSSVDRPPEERPDPFGNQWRQSAELHQIAAIRVENLYALHVRKAAGTINVEDFWRGLFETNGVFALGT